MIFFTYLKLILNIERFTEIVCDKKLLKAFFSIFLKKGVFLKCNLKKDFVWLWQLYYLRA